MKHEIFCVDFAERTVEVIEAVKHSSKGLLASLDAGGEIIRADVAGTVITYIVRSPKD